MSDIWSKNSFQEEIACFPLKLMSEFQEKKRSYKPLKISEAELRVEHQLLPVCGTLESHKCVVICMLGLLALKQTA